MNKKPKTFIFILLSFVVFAFFPGKYSNRIFNEECSDYCMDIATEPTKNNQCKPPLDGFSVICLGVALEQDCLKTSKCFSKCENICIGIVTGTGAAPNLVEAKLNFINGN